MVNTEDSEESEAAREEVESPTNREKIEESQKFEGRIPSINLAINNFEEAETGTKMANNLDYRKMNIEVYKDSELDKEKIKRIKEEVKYLELMREASERLNEEKEVHEILDDIEEK